MAATLASVPAPIVALHPAQEIGRTWPLTGPPVVVTAVTDLHPRVRCTQPGRNSFELDTPAGLAHLAFVAEALTRTTTGATQHSERPGSASVARTAMSPELRTQVRRGKRADGHHLGEGCSQLLHLAKGGSGSP